MTALAILIGVAVLACIAIWATNELTRSRRPAPVRRAARPATRIHSRASAPVGRVRAASSRPRARPAVARMAAGRGPQSRAVRINGRRVENPSALCIVCGRPARSCSGH